MATTDADETRFHELILYVADQCFGDDRFEWSGREIADVDRHEAAP